MNWKPFALGCAGFFGTMLTIVPGFMLSSIHPALIGVYIAAEAGFLIYCIRVRRNDQWDRSLTSGIIAASALKLVFMLTVGWCIALINTNYH